jgi:hypothetical protein
MAPGYLLSVVLKDDSKEQARLLRAAAARLQRFSWNDNA